MRREASPWLTVKQAAERAQVSVTTILRAVRDSRLRATRINNGRVFRIHESWIDEWLGLDSTARTQKP